MINFAIEQEGYNKAQVDGCIEQIEIKYRKLYLENEALHFQLEQAQQQLEQVQQQLEQERAIDVEASAEKTEAIGRALLDAETLAQHIVRDAREQASKIITDAKKGLPIGKDIENTSDEKLAEINTEDSEPEPRSRTGRILSNIAFYGALVTLLIVVFVYTQSGASRSIFGYSYYNILTTSMQSTIPQGSFILVKETPGEELQVGDDITFFKNADTIVTHRIIGIQANYEDSGQYGFRTQGTDNPSPDKEITYEGNVIGKVVFHIPVLGFVLEYLANHIWLIVIAFALILALTYFLKILFTPDATDTEDTSSVKNKKHTERKGFKNETKNVN